jgi:hypothetical protein
VGYDKLLFHERYVPCAVRVEAEEIVFDLKLIPDQRPTEMSPFTKYQLRSTVNLLRRYGELSVQVVQNLKRHIQNIRIFSVLLQIVHQLHGEGATFCKHSFVTYIDQI